MNLTKGSGCSILPLSDRIWVLQFSWIEINSHTRPIPLTAIQAYYEMSL